jgi:hypothetical protein
MTIAPDISENSGEEWVAGGSKYLPENQTIVETYALAKTGNQILYESNAPKNIGLLSIDVEGAELEVLKGIDFGQYSFGIILIETAIESESNLFLLAKGCSFYKHIGQSRIFIHSKTNSKILSA